MSLEKTASYLRWMFKCHSNPYFQPVVLIKEGVPGNLIDKRLQFFGLVRPGERPAHVAGGVAHVGTNAARSPLLLVAQGFDNKWYNCRETRETDEWLHQKQSQSCTSVHFSLCIEAVITV